MTQTIEQLTARVRELEEENARLVSAIDEHMVVSHIGVFNRGDDPKDALNKIACYEQGIGEYFGKELRDQLAASQAYAEHLRDNHKAVVRKANMLDVLPVAMISHDALALPRDTSALDAYVSEKVKEQKEAADFNFEQYQDLGAELDKVCRQRDLAVEAASDAATSLETIQLRSFGEESYLDSKPQMRAFAGARAKIARDIISTIKESEAMAQGEKGV